MKSPIVNDNRNQLSEVIPLTTPYDLFVDPSNVCNFKCNFCAPQTKDSNRGFKKQFMSLDLFKKLIDDATGFPQKFKILRMYTMGEPLLNPMFCQMVEYAKQKNVADMIETVTNGSVLNPELNQKLVDSGIDRIRISIEATTPEEYGTICGYKIDYQKFVENIADLFKRSRGKCQIYIKTVDVSVSTKEKKKLFFDTYQDICDNIFVENVAPIWPDFDEIKDQYTAPDKGLMGTDLINKIKVCPFIYYGCVVNPDGQVTPCCADWERGYVYGNVADSDLKDIWGGNRMKTFWINMLKGNKDMYSSCKSCEYLTFAANENIDDSAARILERL